MNTSSLPLRAFCFCLAAAAVFVAVPTRAAEDVLARVDEAIDRVDRALTITAFDDRVRVRLSGTIDLEYYNFPQLPTYLIDANGHNLFAPRFTFFLDAQVGSQFYLFVQSRIDRGFDPADDAVRMRLDEIALRWTPWEDGRFNLQIGKFATVVGNWVERHLSWDNPFINAPLVYENVTQIEDKAAPRDAFEFAGGGIDEKYEHNPVIWGPVYATGVAVSGRVKEFSYAAELKNSSISSRPQTWDSTDIDFRHPTFSTRLGYKPNQAWNFGLSFSEGTYFRSEAERTLPRGRGIGDYREFLLGQDIYYARHKLQIWAEFFEARFEVPRVGNADTFSYYIEARYKFTPQFFGALRWNQQLFADVPDGTGGRSLWGFDLWRLDSALGFRFTPHTQVKFQYSFEQETNGRRDARHTFGAQFTVRY